MPLKKVIPPRALKRIEREWRDQAIARVLARRC